MRDDEGDGQLAELLDTSFGAGPDGLPRPSQRLAAGQRALRRRHRAGIAGATVAVVAVLGLGVAVAGAVGDGSDADGPMLPPATSGTSATPSATSLDAEREAALDRLAKKAQQQAHRIEQQLVTYQFPASFGPDGQVVVKDGWRITQRIEEPLGYEPPEASLGVVVSDGAQTRWMLLMLSRETDGQGRPIDDLGMSAAADDPGKAYSRFEDWLASQVLLQNSGDVAAAHALIAVDDADQLQPLPGVELREVRPMPLIDGYTASGDRMAEVRWEGRPWFVLVRGHVKEADVIPVDAAVLSEPTFAAFVDHVRSQVTSGEGLR